MMFLGTLFQFGNGKILAPLASWNSLLRQNPPPPNPLPRGEGEPDRHDSLLRGEGEPDPLQTGTTPSHEGRGAKPAKRPPPLWGRAGVGGERLPLRYASQPPLVLSGNGTYDLHGVDVGVETFEGAHFLGQAHQHQQGFQPFAQPEQVSLLVPRRVGLNDKAISCKKFTKFSKILKLILL